MFKLRSHHRIAQPVLIVEDSSLLAQVTSAMLETRWGCQSHIAATLAETRSLLDRNGSDYAVAICDLNLPDAPHGEIIDLLNKTGIPIIAVSGVFGDDLREMVVKKGVADYVLKEGRCTYDYIVETVGRLHRNRSISALILDDSLSARAVVTHMFKTQCLNSVAAGDGTEGLRMLDEHPEIRLAIVDYNMPVMDGFRFTLEARKKFPKEQLIIIGVSASNEKNTAAKFLKFGANDFIFKPFSYEEMYCRISQNLDNLEKFEMLGLAARRDYLTGLSNRRHFFEVGREIHGDARKNLTPLSLAVIDLDHFKKINDTRGHSGGDDVLRHIARLLEAHFGDALVARLGGEEFAVLSTGLPVGEFRRVCEEFVQVVGKSPAPGGGQAIPYTISIGLSDVQDNFDTMLKIADDHLYRAKAAGRNRVEA